jgi:aminoglycoside phosphotransferase (APT) family kinase protein
MEHKMMMLDDYGGLLDWPRLQDWVVQQPTIPGEGPVFSVTRLTGGSQNNLFLMHRAGAAFVLRRPPKHLRDNSNATIMREVRLLSALRGSAVPHAELHAACADSDVIGANFYVMAVLEGYSVYGPLQGRYATERSWRAAIGEELVRASVALAAVDYQACGLEDYGRAEDWHARQVDRWRSQLENYLALPGYTALELDVDDIGRWLSDNVPADGRIGLIHGDYQFPNIMFSLERPAITGLIDWELSTLGDPLLDLGWVLSSWWEEGDPPGKTPACTPWDGFLSRKELVRLYGESSGRDMAPMPWYLVLACYKLAILLEGSYVRSKAGKMPAEVGENLHRHALWLVQKGRQVVARGEI